MIRNEEFESDEQTKLSKLTDKHKSFSTLFTHAIPLNRKFYREKLELV